MKTCLICFSVCTAALFMSCEKEKVKSLPELTGTYIGKTSHHSNKLEEIFTSPTESHYEWVSDSFTRLPDTLIAAEVSKDSFVLQGSAAQHLPAEWRGFAFDEHTGPQVFIFTRSFVLPNYFSKKMELRFDTENKTLILEYHSNSYIPAFDVKISFEGSR